MSTPSGPQVLERGEGGVGGVLQPSKPVAVGLREACRRIGIGYSTGALRVSLGTFPIPALPRRRGSRQHWRFSERDIDRYLSTAATADVR